MEEDICNKLIGAIQDSRQSLQIAPYSRFFKEWHIPYGSQPCSQTFAHVLTSFQEELKTVCREEQRQDTMHQLISFVQTFAFESLPESYWSEWCDLVGRLFTHYICTKTWTYYSRLQILWEMAEQLTSESSLEGQQETDSEESNEIQGEEEENVKPIESLQPQQKEISEWFPHLKTNAEIFSPSAWYQMRQMSGCYSQQKSVENALEEMMKIHDMDNYFDAGQETEVTEMDEGFSSELVGDLRETRQMDPTKEIQTTESQSEFKTLKIHQAELSAMEERYQTEMVKVKETHKQELSVATSRQNTDLSICKAHQTEINQLRKMVADLKHRLGDSEAKHTNQSRAWEESERDWKTRIDTLTAALHLNAIIIKQFFSQHCSDEKTIQELCDAFTPKTAR